MKSTLNTKLGAFDLNKATNLGSGMYGVAYGVTDKLVVKVTSNEAEYLNACEMKGHDIPHVWKVFDCGRIRSRTLMAWLSNEHYQFEEPYDGLFYIIGERLHRSRSKKTGVGPATARDRAYEALEELGVYHEDNHSGNLLFTRGGTPKFVDIM